MEFKVILDGILKDRGISVEKLGEISKIPLHFLNGYLKGSLYPSSKALEDISQALGISKEELLEFSDFNPSEEIAGADILILNKLRAKDLIKQLINLIRPLLITEAIGIFCGLFLTWFAFDFINISWLGYLSFALTILLLIAFAIYPISICISVKKEEKRQREWFYKLGVFPDCFEVKIYSDFSLISHKEKLIDITRVIKTKKMWIVCFADKKSFYILTSDLDRYPHLKAMIN